MFDDTIKIPTLRADHYVHKKEAYVPIPGRDDGVQTLRDDGGVQHLDVGYLGVLVQVRDGAVTLSAGCAELGDGYGFESDLAPQGARLLAITLTAAADEVSEQEVTQ